MTTAAEIVSRALRLLGVIDPDEAPEASQFQGARAALNAMLRRWEANGTALGWTPVVNPADVLSVPEEAEQAITYNLAVLLRPEYGVSLESDIVALARAGMADLERDVLVSNPLRVVSRNVRCGRYNILTDSYDYGYYR